MRTCLILLCVFFGVIAGNDSGIFADFLNEESAAAFHAEEAKTGYRLVAKREPTEENLVRSLDFKTVSRNEVAVALEVLLATRYYSKDIYNKLCECHKGSDWWLIRVKSLELLAHINRVEGSELAEKFFKDEENRLVARITLARGLESQEIFSGYPVLKEGLVSSDKMLRRASGELFNLYLKHEGKVYNKQGDRINAEQMLLEVEKQLDEMKKEALELRKTMAEKKTGPVK